MAKEMTRPQKIALSFIIPILISILLGYHFFINIKSPVYPWWHTFGNDIDGTYVAQTLAMLNGKELVMIDHPGGTIYTGFGIALRWLSIFRHKYSMFFYLESTPTMAVGFAVFDQATRFCRVVHFFTCVALVWVIFFLLLTLTRNFFISAAMTFFFGTSSAFIMHLFMIRPEVLNLFFLGLGLMVLLLFLNKIESPRKIIFGSWLLGFCAGLSLLAKIQVIPLIFALFIFQGFYAWGKEGNPKSLKIWQAWGLILAIINLFIFPWWSVHRPDMVTDAYLASMPIGWDRRRVYGPAPETLAPIFLAIFLIAFFLSLWFYFRPAGRHRRIPLLLAISNATFLGGSFAIYFVLMPLATSLKNYFSTTNNLVYALLTNLIFGAFKHKNIDWNTPANIIALHAGQSQFLHVNILLFVLIAAIVSAVRIFCRTTKDRSFYIGVLVFFVLGLMMDALGSMRMQRDSIVSYYAIYSLFCHSLGLGLWAALEWKRATWGNAWFNFKTAAVFLVILHVCFIVTMYIQYPKASGLTDQEPQQEFNNVKSLARPFWDILENRP